GRSGAGAGTPGDGARGRGPVPASGEYSKEPRTAMRSEASAQLRAAARGREMRTRRTRRQAQAVSRGGRSGGSLTGPVASGAALHRAALVLAESTPDAGVLTGLERPLQALLDHRAAAADGLGFLDLQQRRTGVADGEEELGVFLAANGVVTPVHGCYLSLVL